MCKHILLRGKNTGQYCSKDVYEGEEYCYNHLFLYITPKDLQEKTAEHYKKIRDDKIKNSIQVKSTDNVYITYEDGRSELLEELLQRLKETEEMLQNAEDNACRCRTGWGY